MGNIKLATEGKNCKHYRFNTPPPTDITTSRSTSRNTQDPSCWKKNNTKDADKDKCHAADLTMA
jgi:hypothetical protein